MQSKYIIVPMLFSMLAFGGTTTALARAATVPAYESTFEKLKEVLLSIRHFFDDTLATVTGLYATTGATGQLSVATADFGVVEYYPNLKTKIGLSSNAKNSALSFAVTGTDNKLDKIGPGMICANIEFDLEYKHPGEANAVVIETTDALGNRSTLPVPSDWFKAYQKSIGDSNVPQLYQLTGAALQYQIPGFSRTAKSVHPLPTDVIGNADFMGQWTASINHSYPVYWSFWNEPGHTLMGIVRTRDELGAIILPNETGAEFEVRKVAQAGSSSLAFAKLYAEHESKIRKSMRSGSQIGLASFLAADFNPYKPTFDNSVYFEAVTNKLKNTYKKTSVDFISFNNFNGAWPISFSGARTVLGSRTDTGPFIVTQYSPESLKVTEEGNLLTDRAIPPMQVSVDMLTDLAQVSRAADVRSVCMSYWVAGSNYAFLKDKGDGKLVEIERFKTLQLYTQLPTVRTKFDFGATGLEAKGVHGLAGVNQSKVAVLLWNDSNLSVTVPLALVRIPKNLVYGVVSKISSVNTELTNEQYTVGDTIDLPAYSVALIEIKASSTVSDPLLRRHSIVSSSSVPTRFLQTKSIVDRIPSTCTDATKLPNITDCSKTTGTYGFYDSVRSVAYLGRGEGDTEASVTATYENLPMKLYVNPLIFTQIGFTAATTSLPIVVTATFPACTTTIPAMYSNEGYWILDFSHTNMNPACRNGKNGTLTFSMLGMVPTGTQAEIYISSNITEAKNLALNNKLIQNRATPADVRENLVVPLSRVALRETLFASLLVKAVVACKQNVVVCTPQSYTGNLLLVDENQVPVSSFTSSALGTLVEGTYGKYKIMTNPAEDSGKNPLPCKVTAGDIKISTDVVNEVTVTCPEQ